MPWAIVRRHRKPSRHGARESHCKWYNYRGQVKYIQEQAGHGSIQVTMDTYGHLFPSGDRGWVGQLDETGGPVKSATQPQPARGVAEQGSPKSLGSLVAVTRIERVTRGL